MPSNAREELIEAMADMVAQRAGFDSVAVAEPLELRVILRNDAHAVLDALLARRELLLEALGGQQVACNGSQATVLDFTDREWWRFPVVSGEQEEPG